MLGVRLCLQVLVVGRWYGTQKVRIEPVKARVTSQGACSPLAMPLKEGSKGSMYASQLSIGWGVRSSLQ